jgi:hypothetical protein
MSSRKWGEMTSSDIKSRIILQQKRPFRGIQGWSFFWLNVVCRGFFGHETVSIGSKRMDSIGGTFIANGTRKCCKIEGDGFDDEKISWGVFSRLCGRDEEGTGIATW